MPFYLTISEGPRADKARPIIACSDQRIVRSVFRMIAEMAESYLDLDSEAVDRLVEESDLHLVPREETGGG